MRATFVAIVAVLLAASWAPAGVYKAVSRVAVTTNACSGWEGSTWTDLGNATAADGVCAVCYMAPAVMTTNIGDAWISLSVTGQASAVNVATNYQSPPGFAPWVTHGGASNDLWGFSGPLYGSGLWGAGLTVDARYFAAGVDTYNPPYDEFVNLSSSLHADGFFDWRSLPRTAQIIGIEIEVNAYTGNSEHQIGVDYVQATVWYDYTTRRRPGPACE